MEVQLTGTIRSEPALLAWLAAGNLRGATALSLWHAELGDAAAAAIAGSPDADALVDLDLSWNRIGPAGAATIARGLRLRRLRLYHNDVGPTGATAIGAAARGLEDLNLCGNGLGPAGMAPLGELTLLRELALGYNGLDDGAAEALAVRRLPIARLNIRANELGPAGVTALLSGRLPALRRLGLDENPLGDAGLAALLAAPGFAQLEWLNLNGTELDDRAVARFAAVERCALRELRVHDNDLSPEALAELRALPALADCEVRTWPG